MNEREIFMAALELDDPVSRPGFLDRACAGNAALRARVEALLREHDKTGSFFLDVPLQNVSRDAVEGSLSEGPGSRIGPYRILQQIGEGGMGVVYMAEQKEPVERRVALKIIKPGMDTRQVIIRFEAERQALALMDHPNIARVFDAGTTDSGRPYFAMELVKGVPMTQFCDRQHLTLRDRLKLLLPVCHAVQHAHQKGIIHRDLKPSNVMIALYDGQPVPKVIDFGVAKATGAKLTDRTMFTEFGQVVGTLEYMAPEQAVMNQLDIDTRSDIYSLGVMLYELLTGSTPLDGRRLRSAAFDEMLKMIREEDPPKPSTRLSTCAELPAIARNRGTEPKRLGVMMRGELDWIVMKALEKDRARRYETANGLAMDIQRYLDDEPVLACPPSPIYKFRKFASRNRGVLVTAGLVSAALVFGTLLSTIEAFRATRAEGEAEQHLLAEREARSQADDARQKAEASRKEALDQRDRALKAEQQAEANFRNARKAVDEYFTLVSESTLFDVPGLQSVRKDLLEAALRFYQGFATDRVDDPGVLADLAVTYMRVAVINQAVDRNDDAVAAVNKALDAIDRLRREFPEAREQHRQLAGFWRGWRNTRTATEMPRDPEQAFQSLIRLAETWKSLGDANPQESRFQTDLAAIDRYIADLVSSAGNHAKSIPFLENAKTILEKVVDDEPGVPEHRADLARVLQYLSTSLYFTNRNQEAEAACRRSLALREQLVIDSPKVPQHRADLLLSLNQLSGHVVHKDSAEAQRISTRAIAVGKQLVSEAPFSAMYRDKLNEARVNLAGALPNDKDDSAEIKAERRKLLAEVEEPVAEEENESKRRLAFAHRKTWERLVARPEGLEEAATIQRRELNAWDELAAASPDNSQYPEQKAHSLRLWGFAHSGAGRREEALVALREAVLVLDKLIVAHPEKVYFRSLLADTHICLSREYRQSRQFDEAQRAARRAIELNQQLVAENPGSSEYKAETAKYLLGLCELLDDTNHPDAMPTFRQALTWLQGVADAAPKEAIWRQAIAEVHFRLGWREHARGHSEDANREFLEAAAIQKKLLTEFPDHQADFRAGLASSLAGLAEVAVKARDYSEAARLLGESIDAHPDGDFEFRRAPLLLLTGEQAEYARYRREMLSRYRDTKHLQLAERAAKACLLAPLDAAEAAECVALTQRAAGTDVDWLLPWANLARGMASYREGDFAAALKWLDDDHIDHVSVSWFPFVEAELIVAMAHQRLGQPVAAERSLAAARSRLAEATAHFDAGHFDGNWHDWLISRVLEREATALIEPQAADGSKAATSNAGEKAPTTTPN